MIRRSFLKSLGVTAAGLLVAPDLLERTHRKIFPVGIDLRTKAQRFGYERWRFRGVNHAGQVIEMDIADAFAPAHTGVIRIGSEVHELVSWRVVRE